MLSFKDCIKQTQYSETANGIAEIIGVYFTADVYPYSKVYVSNWWFVTRGTVYTYDDVL